MRALTSPDIKTTPYWWEAAPRPLMPAPDLPPRIDVAVVGSGFSGLTAALTLARAGRSVLVFEADDPGAGASTMNGGIAGGTLRVPLGTLIRKIGLGPAAAFYSEGRDARAFLARFIADEDIECAYSPVGRFRGAHTASHYEALAREAELLARHAGIEAHMVPGNEVESEIFTDVYCGGEIRPDIAGLHPGLFHQGLLRRAQEAGAVVAARTRVLGIERDGGGFQVATERGPVGAGDVLVATNGYTGAATPWFRRRIIPIRSQIIATSRQPEFVMDRLMPKRRMFGDTRHLYSYFRPTPDGRGIIFGGRAGAAVDDPRLSGGHLYADLTRIFDELAGVQITHTWAGYTGYTFDTRPHVGVRDGIHYAIGYCGSGVVWAPWLGRKAALKILGVPEATMFDGATFPTRPFYGGRPWFLPGVMAWYGLLDRLRI